MKLTSFEELKKRAGNTFTPGTPIRAGDLFRGRSEQMKTIVDAFTRPGCHVVLFGERGVGKTSLANVLAYFIQKRSSLFPMPKVNCGATDTFASIWKKLLDQVTITETVPLTGFTNKTESLVTKASSRVPDKPQPQDIVDLVREIFAEQRFVPIFDEFDRITDRRTRVQMADLIKSLSDNGSNCTIILIGVADSVDHLIEGHESIERCLIQVLMPRMSRSELLDILSTGLDRLEMKIETAAAESIVRFSQGLPHITHLLALHSTLCALDKQTSKITGDHLENGVAAALKEWQRATSRAYYDATVSPQPGHMFKEVLLACALTDGDELGYFAAADVRVPLQKILNRSVGISSYSRHLRELVSRNRGGIIESIGTKGRVRYRFSGPLLRPYIIMRAYVDQLINQDDLKIITN